MFLSQTKGRGSAAKLPLQPEHRSLIMARDNKPTSLNAALKMLTDEFETATGPREIQKVHPLMLRNYLCNRTCNTL